MIEERTCPNCHKRYNDPANMEAIDRIGECLNCDHVRGETLEQQKAEADEDEE